MGIVTRALVLLGVLFCPPALAQDDDARAGEDAAPQKRAPVPDAAATAEAEKLVADLYKQDLGPKATPGAKAAVARKLRDAAGETNDDIAARYVLLRTAAELAAAAGDFAASAEAADELARLYRVSAEDVTLAAIEKAVAAL